MKIVFMGTPVFSVPTLDMLKEDGHEIAAVFTQPDRPRGRGKKLLPTPVKEKALAYGLSVYQPQSLRKGADAEEALRILQEIKPDLIIVRFCRRRFWSCRNTAASICMPPCCPAGEVLRRFSVRFLRVTAKQASLQCRWRRDLIPVICCIR